MRVKKSRTNKSLYSVVFSGAQIATVIITNEVLVFSYPLNKSDISWGIAVRLIIVLLSVLIIITNLMFNILRFRISSIVILFALWICYNIFLFDFYDYRPNRTLMWMFLSNFMGILSVLYYYYYYHKIKPSKNNNLDQVIDSDSISE